MYRIRLSNLKDKEDVFHMARDCAYRQYYQNAPVNGFSEDTLLHNIQGEIEGGRDTNGLYVVEDEAQAIVGACSFYDTYHRNGYTLLRFYSRNGLNETAETETFYKILGLCFLDLNFNKVNIDLKASQLKYAGVFRKSGFIEEVRLKEHFYSDGRYEDIIHLGLTREDYLNKKRGEPEDQEEACMRTPDEDYLLKTNLQPAKQLLFGENVDLTEFDKEDGDMIYEACKASDFKQFASIAAPGPVHKHDSAEVTGNDYMFFKKRLQFAIRTKDGRVVGSIGANMIDHRDRNLMIGLEIFSTKERGKGYGSEAVRLFTDYAFLEMNMHRVYLGCFEFNTHASYLYEKLGFQPEGTNRAFVYRNGAYYNERAFGVVKKDWLLLRGYL